MWEDGVTDTQVNAVLAAIQSVLLLAGVHQRVALKNFGAWRNTGWRVGDTLTPYNSIDWYLARARQTSDRPGKLNASTLINDLTCEPWQEREPHYDVTIVRQDMYSGTMDNNFVIGIAVAGIGTVVSVEKFLTLDEPTQIGCIMTETAHELGHVFELTADPRRSGLVDCMGAHCANVCVMRQGIRLPIDWVNMARDARRVGIYCPTCQEYLRRYFGL